jgi:hypothetical protein
MPICLYLHLSVYTCMWGSPSTPEDPCSPSHTYTHIHIYTHTHTYTHIPVSGVLLRARGAHVPHLAFGHLPAALEDLGAEVHLKELLRTPEAASAETSCGMQKRAALVHAIWRSLFVSHLPRLEIVPALDRAALECSSVSAKRTVARVIMGVNGREICLQCHL